MKRIVLLGSTGSIGRNVLDVVSRHADRFEVVALGARSSAADLAAQCRAFPTARVAMTDPDGRAALLAAGVDPARVLPAGEDSLGALVSESGADLVVNAVVGFAGLRPTMAAVEAGVDVAIANKETVVTGGEILLAAARRSGAAIIPIDSEHVAISQCLATARREDIARVIMTASGGALRDHDPEAMAGVTVDDVLAHPTWDMGAKITVDSATLVNKGLEVIEAHWLFGLPYDSIDVVVHPQSIVHSFVEFVDGSIISQMGQPDMRLPILYALSYPERVASPLRDDVCDFPSLTFEQVDRKRYPCFGLVLEAAREGGSAPTILNAANEIAVGAFLTGDLPYDRIHGVIADALDGVPRRALESLDDIIATDRATREWLARDQRSRKVTE
jgi:1-deoxy-D-xylulose-5-phosphate reductoisomerase